MHILEDISVWNMVLTIDSWSCWSRSGRGRARSRTRPSGSAPRWISGCSSGTRTAPPCRPFLSVPTRWPGRPSCGPCRTAAADRGPAAAPARCRRCRRPGRRCPFSGSTTSRAAPSSTWGCAGGGAVPPPGRCTRGPAAAARTGSFRLELSN